MTSLQLKQCQNIANILTDQSFVKDLQCEIGSDDNKQTFQINGLLLAAISLTWQRMLYGNNQWIENQSRKLEIVDADPEIFKIIIDFAYCKEIKITMKNIMEVRCFADRYLISSLTEFCDEHINTNLDINNFCTTFNKAVERNDDWCITKCTFIMQHKLGLYTDDILATSAFMNMSTKTMTAFLKMDSLFVKEDELFNAVVMWAHNQHFDGQQPANKKVKIDADTRSLNDRDRVLLRKIYKNIRFGSMTGKYFVEIVEPLKLLETEELITILNYFTYRKSGCGPFVTKKRIFKKEVIIERGIIDINKLWLFNDNKKDAIKIISHVNIKLTAIGIMNCKGKLSIEFKVYEHENGKGKKINVIAKSVRHTVESKEISKIPVKIKLIKPVDIKKYNEYIIEVTQHNQNGAGSYSVSNGKTTIDFNQTIKIEIENATSSPNGTNPEEGAIPLLYFEKEYMK